MHRKDETLLLLQSNLEAILDFNVGEVSHEVTADRALQEIGALIRKLDDAEAIAARLKQHGLGKVGSVTQGDGRSEPLYLRDMTNKVAHCSKFSWQTDAQRVECTSREPLRWKSATIDLTLLKEVVQIMVTLQP